MVKLTSGSKYSSFASSSSHSSMPLTYHNALSFSPMELTGKLVALREGRMSVSRRFFCLLTIFDTLFIFLLWSIYCALESVNSKTVIKVQILKEIQEYSFKSSFFDILVFTVLKDLILLLTYGYFSWSHWFFITLTTSSVTILILTKVFLFDNFTVHVFSVFFITSTLLVAWAQALQFDFQVIPFENKASILLAEYINTSAPSIFIPQFSSSYQPTPFFSPTESLCGDNEEVAQFSVSSTILVEPLLSEEDRRYKELAEHNLEEFILLMHGGQWKTEKVHGLDTILSCSDPQFGKLFKYIGTILYPPDKVINILHESNISRWNPTVKHSEVLKTIDDEVDITYTISAEGLGGMVSSRDFVNLRYWKKRGNTYLQCFSAIEHSSRPKTDIYVRGMQGPSMYVLVPLDNDPTKCRFEWLLNVDLKGWLSRKIVDKNITHTMVVFVQHLREHIASMNLQNMNSIAA